jgi:uncharacterized protein (DUF952 family)/GNAT superfamily N-acetyltransferase
VDSSLIVRPARVEDIEPMARVHVRCWQETYRGLMPDDVLDDPGFPAARERLWTAALTDERYRRNRVAVAERDGELVGVAMSGPAAEGAGSRERQLYVLYVYASAHGTGAGRGLLEAVTDAGEPTVLWVADPNPRAQAFYRKHGFVADGTVRHEDGLRELRMVRGSSAIIGRVLIYKILLPDEWAAFEAAGSFDGSPFDHESGFIHCSSRAQVADTATRVFADEPALVVAAVDTTSLGDSVRWEDASSGRFPHIYGSLPLSAVSAVYKVARAPAIDEALPRPQARTSSAAPPNPSRQVPIMHIMLS